ncbi:hypothetical protein NIIDMKKI_33660 [Mycobacterium kansasii]|uniref:CinA C-terminal domain-containing protein n=1 Tax=Mycobacterium kansasii TaxID=1768 RepID=A0A7G1IBE2_MYCKA|nr:hypothetical protein NIIDMKKI_33660 [Mycobacterium kansasii]
MVTRYEPPDADVYAQLTKLLRDKHGHQIYSEDGSQVDDVVARMLAGRRIATAESCTAGLLSARLTDRPGSSDYVAGGLVVYSDDAKTELLGIDAALIRTHGAVSEPVAQAMAAGALQRFGADTAVAITGIAGPGGERGKSRWERCASPCCSTTAAPSPARCGCPETGPTSANVRRPWPCTCCAAP